MAAPNAIPDTAPASPSSLTPLCLLSLRTDQFPSLSDELPTSGFDGLLWVTDEPLLDLPEHDLLRFLDLCTAAQLKPFVEVDVQKFGVDHALVQSHPDLFSLRWLSSEMGSVDPRRPIPATKALARFRAVGADSLTGPIADRLGELVKRGVAGFNFVDAAKIGPVFVAALLDKVRSLSTGAPFVLADLAGVEPGQIEIFKKAGIDFGTIAATGDVRQIRAVIDMRSQAPGFPLIVKAQTNILVSASSMSVGTLAMSALGDGMIISLDVKGENDGTRSAVARALAVVSATSGYSGEVRTLTSTGSELVALVRSDSMDIRQASRAMMVLINSGSVAIPYPDLTTLTPAIGADFASFDWLDNDDHNSSELAPGELRLLHAARAEPILGVAAGSRDATTAAVDDRLVLEDVHPRVEGGNFSVKRVVGETVTVEATLFADGHEQLAAELQWRETDQDEWQRARMEQLPNDLWRGGFPLMRLGSHEFVIEGWLDRFGGFRRDFAKKLDANVAQPVDYAEGRVLIEQAMAGADSAARETLVGICQQLDKLPAAEEAAKLLLSSEVATLMDGLDERLYRIRSIPQRVDAERLAARFSSWYELFPRSQTEDVGRHGTFADVVERLPAIRAMGFDTLYFPPIHPIGKTNRKGPNNTLTPGPNDPGSPYAIGAPEGGHDALHPELGSFDDFKRLIDAAHHYGLEIALDFAIQCSPDHPWLREHPGWFAWRPDGSMKYAENPPKKYQDIVNVDFYGPDAVPGLWVGLRDVILFWISHGIKTFRVDNPHTKPLPFWEWMIAEVRSQHPDAIFLAEAFTRPAMMYRLAKIGFSQSYTYFTWRNEKAELVDYVTDLTTTEPREFYRPHFFVNTPDINPPFLQTSGRAGFRIRAVLAATLSGLFGVYSGFELCEAAPVPGKEEYLDSEKYEIRPRDLQAPGNIIADITMLNRLRRSEPALQTHLNTRFQVVHNAHIIYYAKPAADGSEMILVMVSLDPHHPQEGAFEVPLWELGLPDDGTVAVEDLVEGHRFRWHSKMQHIRLDPEQPYRIWRIAPGDRS